MSISRRVTARFHKRAKTASPTGASPSGVRREESDVRILPVAETRSDLVATHAQTSRTTHAPSSKSVSLSAYLRDARARAEKILQQHPRHDGRTGSTCPTCLVAYPCDAVRAAADVTAITTKLHLSRLPSSKALLELMIDLVDLGATDTVLENPKADPRAPRAGAQDLPG